MSKLSNTTKSVRKYVLYFLIFSVVVLVGQVVLGYVSGSDPVNDTENSSYAYFDEIYEDFKYPDISSLAIVENSKSSFSIAGKFETFPTSVNVYQTVETRETLGTAGRAESLAESLNITSEYERTDTQYIWRTLDQRLLEYNKTTKDTRYANEGINLEFLRANRPNTPQSESLKTMFNEASTTINQTDTYSLYENTEDTTRSYLIDSNSNYRTSTAAANADYIREDYFDSFEIVSLKVLADNSKEILDPEAEAVMGRVYLDNPKTGSTYIVLSNQKVQDSQQNIAAFIPYLREFRRFNIDLVEENGVYPLIPIVQAWENVKDGKGYLKHLVKQGGDPLDDYSPLAVKRFIATSEATELGYYFQEARPGYIYPIYVFTGLAELKDGTTAEFVFYTEAIEIDEG